MIYAIAAALVLVLDQAVKFWTTKTIPLDAVGDQCVQLIPNVLHVTNIHNTGAAFSILQNSRWLLVGVSAAFIILILILISQEIIHTKFGKWTSVLVMAGAMGNCIDRIIYGHVVDMLELEVFTFPVFNVADIFITVCGILFCIHVIFYNDPAAAAKAAAQRRERGLPPEEEEEPRQAPARRGRKAKAKEQDDRYAAIPHRERSAHRTLAEETRPADPEDPFKEWSFGAPEDEPFVENGTPSRRRRADPFMEGDDSYIEEERPAPRRPRRAAPAPQEEQPIRRRERRVAPTVADEEDDIPAAPAKPEQPPAAPDAGTDEEFSLEDILNEFGNFDDDI